MADREKKDIIYSSAPISPEAAGAVRRLFNEYTDGLRVVEPTDFGQGADAPSLDKK